MKGRSAVKKKPARVSKKDAGTKKPDETREKDLDEALAGSFPASDPPALMQPNRVGHSPH